MPTLRNKADVENQKAKEGSALLPIHQAVMTSGQDSYITIPATPSISSSILGSGQSYYLDIESDEVGRIDDVCLRFRITCSTADVECLPPAYFFNRIVIEAEKGTGDELMHIYPENIVFWNYLTENEEARNQSSYLNNFGRTKYNYENAEKYTINENTKFVAGETRDVYLNLPAVFLHLNALDMRHTRQDVRIRLEFSNDIVVSGDRTNLSLDNLELVIKSFSEESYDYKHRMSRQMANDHKFLYLDHEIMSYNSYTLTAGQKQKFALDQFTGRCPFIIVVIKPNNNPVASDKSKMDFVEIGKDGTFDITDSGSRSLFGNGTAVKQDYLYDIFSKHTNNPHLKGVYLIPFCESVKKSIAGNINGFFEFVGLKDYLEITFDSAPTQEVHQISLGTTATSGTYRYAFENGIISDQELDYDDTTTDIKSAIDDIPQLKERFVTVSVDDSLDNVSTQSITFDSRAGSISEDYGKITILGNGIPKVESTSVSTKGKVGWTTGSNYTVEIHLYKFRCLEVSKNGRISAKDL